MCTWKLETPLTVPAGARISAGIVREGGQVVAEHGTRRREPVAGQLHAIARITGEPDDDVVDLLRLLMCRTLDGVGHDRAPPRSRVLPNFAN